MGALRKPPPEPVTFELAISNLSSLIIVPYRYEPVEADVVEYARPMMINEESTVVLSRDNFVEDTSKVKISMLVGYE